MASPSRLEFWAQLAGLVATGWIIWVTRVAPYWGHAPLMFRIAQTCWIASCALAWSAVIALSVRLVLRHLTRVDALPETLETCLVAVWFAPATFLILQFSPIGIATGLVLAVSAARLLCAPVRPLVSAAAATTEVISAGELPFDPRPRPFFPVLLISAALEAAAILFLMGRPLPAAAMLGLSTAMLTSVALAVRARADHRPPNLPRSAMGLLLTMLMALMVGLAPTGRGLGLWRGWEEGSEAVQTRTQLLPSGAADLPGSFPGVILLPETKPATMLIAPRPSAPRGFPKPSEPLTIPFAGEYWMFRFPASRPPENSYIQRGTPSALSFTTTDHWPMQMEARQNLAQPISTQCCSRIRLAIRNADRYPRTLSIELVLINRELPTSGWQTLGRVPVTSLPSGTPVPETLDFPVPPTIAFHQFDALKVIFYRVPGAARDKSARISIERFVLVP